MTRRVIEDQLDQLRSRVPDRWWIPYAVVGGALVLGLVISRIPMLRLVGAGARTVQTGVIVASTLAALDRFIAERRALRAA